jgi:uncharacterized membrane protein
LTQHREIPEPGELIYLARSSWAPVFFAFGAALALCGLFIEFMVTGWVYSVIGGIVLLAALRSMVRKGRRDYYRLPRKQRVRGAVLPVETISPPRP